MNYLNSPLDLFIFLVHTASEIILMFATVSAEKPQVAALIFFYFFLVAALKLGVFVL